MSVTITKEDPVAIITMDDGKANAINPAMLDALEGALDAAEADEAVGALILTGQPGKFSAGFDLKYFQSEGPEAAAALVNRGGALAHRLYGYPKPVIAAATGHAIAMGCFILQACDVRYCVAGDFRIGANETAINMVLPEFALELLHARIPPQRLTEAAVIARLYDPAGAKDVGYIDEVVAPEALMATAKETAKALAALPAKAYAGNKNAIRRDTLGAIADSLAG
ncbi:MAG: crotonase/enoyl-CoA hydratase family protein [Pseudomonadota bacterium]